MNGCPHEPLDDIVDRVAAGMTRVPEDPGFSIRLESRFARPRSMVRARKAVPLAAALIAALVLGRYATDVRREPGLRHAADLASAPEERRLAMVPLRTPSSSSLHIAARPIGTSSNAAAAGVPPARAAMLASASTAEGRATGIAALPGPITLSLDDLAIEPLTIAAVDLDVLEVPALALREINGLEPKE
jgi:hypothetical protein